MKKYLFVAGVVGLSSIGLVSCDKVNDLKEKVGLGSDEDVPKERKIGLSKVKTSEAAEVKKWIAEPNVVVVVDYYLNDCPQCEQMAPLLEKMAETYGDKAAVLQLNVSNSKENVEYAKETEVDRFPTLKFYLNGEEQKSVVGGLEEKDLDRLFKRYTGKIDGDLTVKADTDLDQGPPMQKVAKSDLPEGISRVVVPKDAEDLGDKKLPNKVLDGVAAPLAAPVPAPKPVPVTRPVPKLTPTPEPTPTPSSPATPQIR